MKRGIKGKGYLALVVVMVSWVGKSKRLWSLWVANSLRWRWLESQWLGWSPASRFPSLGFGTVKRWRSVGGSEALSGWEWVSTACCGGLTKGEELVMVEWGEVVTAVTWHSFIPSGNPQTHLGWLTCHVAIKLITPGKINIVINGLHCTLFPRLESWAETFLLALEAPRHGRCQIITLRGKTLPLTNSQYPFTAGWVGARVLKECLMFLRSAQDSNPGSLGCEPSV